MAEASEDGIDEVGECRKRGYWLSRKKIGSGSFSKVYLGAPTLQKVRSNGRLASGLENRDGNWVAIKVVPISQSLQQQSRHSLSREVNALQTTYKHPNVIQLYESFRSSSRLYLVLELASRGDLLEHINHRAECSRLRGLCEAEAQQMFQQLVRAVSHCHAKHIAHRDLKCENILLDERGCIKLSDFGLASKCSRNSLMSTFCGSLPYTAPEILQGLRYRGDHADIWSMGIILYAMVTGKLPFNKLQPCKLLEEIKGGVLYHDQLSPGYDLTPFLSVEACQDLINKMLQWTPSARLALSDILIHPWMLPATSFLFQKVRVFLAESQPKKQEKTAANKGGSLPPAGGTIAEKVLVVSSTGRHKSASPRKMGPGPVTPLAQPGEQHHPVSREQTPAGHPGELWTRVPRPPTASKPPTRPSAWKRPVSACVRKVELGGRVPGSQEWTQRLDLSKSSHHVVPLAHYLPHQLKGF